MHVFRQNLSIKQTFESTPIFGVEIHRDFIYVKIVGRRGHFPGSERQSSRLSCLRRLLLLRPLRRIRRSLSTLIYAVINSRMDDCNTVLAGAPRTVTDKLQRASNSAARVITGTRKFDRGLG